jgi:hypothetical protein
VITKPARGRVEGGLRAVEFGHRAGWGWDRLFLSAAFREQMATAEGVTVRGHRLPPPREARGFWLALDHLRPGLVCNFGAEHLQIGAPECGSWVRVSPDGDGTCSVTEFGPRGIWHEIEEIAAQWRAAGEPDAYRIEFSADGKQWAVAGSGRNELCWTLRDERPVKGDPQ